MDNKDIQSIKETIERSIQSNVNGKIDALNQKFDNHVVEHDRLMERLDPIVDAVRWINSTRRFVVWIGLPIATLGSIIAATKGWVK